MAVVCGICHEEGISEIGELDCCEHSFCHPCITQWAEIETRCPFCKSRFTQIQRKRLDLDALADAGDDALGEGDGDAVIRQRWPGTVLETTVVPERNQRNAAEGQLPEDGDEFEEDPMDTVYCTECGDGGDEACLLLCDGCDRPCHTYCAGLDGVPDGEWFCAACEERRAGQALHDPARAPAPAATGGRRTRASRGASAPSRQPAQSNATRLAMVAAERSSGGGVSQARSAPMTRRVRQRLMQRRGSRAVRVPVPAPPASPPRNMYDAAASHAHRRVDEMRGNWEALRRGHATFDHRPTSSSVSNGSRVESTAHAPPDQPEASAREQARSRAVAALAQAQFGPRQGSEDVDVSSAWSQLEAIRQQAQQAQQQQQQQRSRPSATRQRSTGYIPTGSFGSSEEDEDEEGPQHSLGSAFRAELRQARDLGRRMGPTGRVASGQRRPSMRRAPSAAFTIDHTRARMQAARAAKEAVVAQVKEMLKPMYHRKAISRDEFKALAKAATAVLVRGEAQGAADAVQRAAEVTGIPVQSL
ncbi:hypothetical protein WJX72_007809 [[Myrmecia] bisecta]|uniref:PHD and RING finger domain-containing protein 1 n=1 Tax=[Myrmecia] bisecta TaxID=41462 RepID=A0AAW1R8T2_9CHLO